MCKNHRAKNLFIVLFMVGFLLPGGLFSFDLLDEVNSIMQKLGDPALSDEYVSRAYSPKFSKDPFGDAVDIEFDKSNKPKVAGVEYVKDALNAAGCPMSDKKIYGILYYYVDGFKENLVRDMKIGLGDYDSTKYELSREKVLDYCREYIACYESKGNSAWQVFMDSLKCAEKDENGNCIKDERGTNYTKNDESHKISKGTSANLETNCKEFFENKYYEGEYNELNKQNVRVSQMGTDKYWNKTTDDSPYDIMEDMGELSKLLYLDGQDPISPVFYNIPSFSNSKKALRNGKKASETSDDVGSSGDTGDGGEPENEEKQDESGEQGDDNPGGGDNQGNPNNPSIAPMSPLGFDEVYNYDDLVEGLGAYTLASDGSEFYTNLCDNRSELEQDLEVEQEDDVDNQSLDIEDLSEEEYQEIIDYMLGAVDDYASLPADKEDEINEKIGDKSGFGTEASAESIDEAIEKIKNCWKSCEGLRVDQKASCMVKCACGEIKSPIFDPEETPGLGPIFMIRFCAVPAVATKFSVGGKRIHSIEDGLREIYGVVDKLSREGKLGKWTQQYEFLDSSTKRMNFADTFAFTIDVEFVDIANKLPNHSEQYQKKELEKDNETAQVQYNIKNSLNTAAGRNAYLVAGGGSETRDGKNVGDSTNSKKSDNLQSELDENFEMYVDLFENADADLHVKTELSLSLWLNQQMELWEIAKYYIESLISSANLLNGKGKCS